MRGEYRYFACGEYGEKETPPLARGILIDVERNQITTRNTPACAGNTVSLAFVNFSVGKHPRLRGEYSRKIGHVCRGLETPPLARGIPECLGGIDSTVGNTPACAGNTVLLLRPLMLLPETPPLARGIRFNRTNQTIDSGNTPACAGNTGQSTF